MATEEPTAEQRKGGTEDLKGKVSSMLRSRQEKMQALEDAEKEKQRKIGEAKEAKYRKGLERAAAKKERQDVRQERRAERRAGRAEAPQADTEDYPGQAHRKTLEDAADVSLMQTVEAEQPTAEEIERVRAFAAGGLSPDEIAGSGEVDIVAPTPEEIEKVRKWVFNLSQEETTGGDGRRYGVVPRAITPEYDESTAPGQNLEPGGSGPQPEEGNIIGIRRASPEEQADLERQRGLRYEFMEGAGPEGQDILRPSRPEDVIDVKFEDDSLDVEGGYINPDLTPRAEGREAAADAGMLKKSMDDAGFDYTQKSSWSGLGGYNYTYVPDPQGRLGKIVVDSAPGSSMKGKSAVVSATSKNAKGENIFEAIMAERLRGKTGAVLSDAQQAKMRSAPPPPPPGKTDTDTAPFGPPPPPPPGKTDTDTDTDAAPPPRKDTDAMTEDQRLEQEAAQHEENARRLREEAEQHARDAAALEASIGIEARNQAVRDFNQMLRASSEGEPAGEVDRVTPREDYQGGDPTPDEIRSVVSELSPSAKIAKQKFTVSQTEDAVSKAKSAVQQAQDNLAEAIKITETTGDTTAQTEAEAILDRERARLQEAIVLNTLEKKKSRVLDREAGESREAERLRAAERYRYEDPEARPIKWTR